MDFLESMGREVVEAMSADLSRSYTAKEVYDAIRQMHLSKTPSPIGMAPLFYQRHWHSVGPTITNTIMDALKIGQYPNELNHTFFTLILNKK